MPPSQASEHHKRVTTSVDDDDIDPQVDQQGCGKVYSQLEECLGENNRDWRLCQKGAVCIVTDALLYAPLRLIGVTEYS
ncbi:TPA: hypothetical protein ACH3X2_003265 [Trebouxia sp. C0005]